MPKFQSRVAKLAWGFATKSVLPRHLSLHPRCCLAKCAVEILNSTQLGLSDPSSTDCSDRVVSGCILRDPHKMNDNHQQTIFEYQLLRDNQNL
jgi:hypothetical protein